MTIVSPEGQATSFRRGRHRLLVWRGLGDPARAAGYDGVLLRESELAFMPRATFMALLDRNFGFNRFIIDQLNERLRQFVGLAQRDRLLEPNGASRYPSARFTTGCFRPASNRRSSSRRRRSRSSPASRASAPTRRSSISRTRGCCASSESGSRSSIWRDCRTSTVRHKADSKAPSSSRAKLAHNTSGSLNNKSSPLHPPPADAGFRGVARAAEIPLCAGTRNRHL